VEIKVLNQNKISNGKKSDVLSKKSAWVNVINPKTSDWLQLSEITGLPAEDLKSFLSARSRPMLRDLDRYTAISFHSPSLNGKSIVTKPNLFLVSESLKNIFIITKGPFPAIEQVMESSPTQLERVFAEGPTQLLYTLLDETIDSYRKVLDHINEEVEAIETAVIRDKVGQEITMRIFQMRKTLVYIVRALYANQEVVSAIEKSHGTFLNEKFEPKFRTLYEDIEQLEDLTSIYREILSSSLEIYHSNVSNNLNIIMKRLTSWAAIILVPSLIASIYGMNLSWLPFAHRPSGFFVVIAVMLLSVLMLYSYFSKKDWL
jgi:magnesium transporter